MNIVDEIAQHDRRHFEKRKNNPAIEFKNLVVDFGETLAVDNLSLKIPQGELVTLLGPSGCGKTTTLNAIAGLLVPTSGKIIFKGRDVTKFSPQKRKLGLVFQNYALYPHMTVYKNIAFPLKNDSNWQGKIKKENELATLEIEKIILGSNGATKKELADFEIKKLNIYDSERETEFYLNKVESFYYEDMNTVKAKKDLVKPHYEAARAKANKTALKKLSSAEDAYRLAKKTADKEQTQALKAELKEKISKIRTDLKELLEKEKLAYEAEKTSVANQVKITQEAMKSSKWNEELKLARKNVKEIPKLAKKQYSEFKSDLVKKYSLKKENLSPQQTKEIEKQQKRIKKLSVAIHETIMQVSEKLDITANLHKYPTKLSGGQQQRVAIARGIVKKPDILLMDEPLSNLDAKLRIEARNWIRSIQQDLGITLIFVTHDQEEAMSISDTVICLNKGKVQQMGSPMELYSKPANVFVAKFLGMPEMKVFDSIATPKGEIQIGGKKVASVDKKYAGKKIRIGVRSEQFKISKTGLKANVGSIEQLGKDLLLHVEFEDKTSGNVLLPAGTSVKEGDNVTLSFSTSKIHVFGPDGRRINVL